MNQTIITASAMSPSPLLGHKTYQPDQSLHDQTSASGLKQLSTQEQLPAEAAIGDKTPSLR